MCYISKYFTEICMGTVASQTVKQVKVYLNYYQTLYMILRLMKTNCLSLEQMCTSCKGVCISRYSETLQSNIIFQTLYR